MTNRTPFIREAMMLADLKLDEHSELVGLAAQTLVEKLGEHWTRLVELADDDEESQVKVNLTLVLTFAGKMPAGALSLAYSSRVKDGTTFRVEDPNQLKMMLSANGGPKVEVDLKKLSRMAAKSKEMEETK